MSPSRYGPTILLTALLLGACDWGGQDSDADGDEEESAPVPVEVGTPARGDIYAVYSGTAPIEAFAEADVVAKVAGEVREILVEEGDDVREGQVLARLDGDRLRLELNQSEANLRRLQRDYERNLDLMDKGLLSSGDFDKIKYEMEALEASYNLAKLELDYTQIRAPIDGVISERFIKIGNTLTVDDPVFRVTNTDPLVAYLHVPEREYRHIAKDQPVVIDIDALPTERIKASVTRVSPIVDADTGTFKITIEISDDRRRIKPGMFGRISIVYDVHVNALQVPRSAILEDGGEFSVFVIEKDKAIRRTVQTGYGQSGMIEITDGLVDADRLVTVGQIGLKDGAIVTVINEDEALQGLAQRDTAEASEDAPAN